MPRRRTEVALFLVLIAALFSETSADPSNGPLKVRSGELIKYLTFSGEVRAKNSITILAPDIRGLHGYTISHLAEDGSFVRPGDLLVQFDATELEVRRLDNEKKREEARIAIAQKEAEIEGRYQDLLLNKALAEKNLKVAELNVKIDASLLSKADFEKYQLEYSKAKIEHDKAQERVTNLEKGSEAELNVVRLDFEQADLELKRLQSSLQKMSVNAPTQGLVLCNENWQSGRKVQKGDAVWDNAPIISLPDLREVQVLADVHSQDYARLQGASSAEIVLDSVPGRIFHARIASLPQAATPYRFRSELKVFRVLLDVDETDTSLFKPGMTARVRVPIKVGSGLIIPRSAVRVGSKSQTSVRLKGTSGLVPVKIRQASEQEVLVEGDLKEGQELEVATSNGTKKARSETEWITVKKEDLTFSVAGTGLLQAEKAVEIRPPRVRDFHRFKIVSMVEEGKSVSQGEPIVEFDKTDVMTRMRDESATLEKVKEQKGRTEASLEVQRKDLELQLEEARVQKEKAVNKLTEAREFESNLKVRTAEYEAAYATGRVEMLEKKLVSVNRHAELQLKILTDRINFYENRLKLAVEAMEALSVKAPISGVVIYKPNWNNEKKQVGSDVFFMDTVMTIPDLNTLLIEGQVAEVDSGKVRTGQAVSITLDAVPDKTFGGRIVNISNIFTQASPDRPVKVLQVRVKLDALDLKRMRPGMVTRLEVVIDRLRDVLAVPLSVIEMENGQSFVWVKKGEGTEKRMVRLGKNNGLVAEITAGLSAGERVVGRPEGPSETAAQTATD